MMKLVLALCLVSNGAFARSSASDEGFSPFLPGEIQGRPEQVTIAVKIVGKGMPCDIDDGPVVFPRFISEIDTKNEEGGGLRLETAPGKFAFDVLPSERKIEVLGSAGSVDLNADGKPDYLLPVYVRAKERRFTDSSQSTLVFLTTRSGFSAWMFRGLFPDGTYDLLTVGDGRSPVLLWSKILEDHGGKKVEDMQYDVRLFHLIRFGANGPELEDALDRRFPAFISHFWNSRRQNHRETELLSSDQKKGLLKLNLPQWEPIALKSGKKHK